VIGAAARHYTDVRDLDDASILRCSVAALETSKKPEVCFPTDKDGVLVTHLLQHAIRGASTLKLGASGSEWPSAGTYRQVSGCDLRCHVCLLVWPRHKFHIVELGGCTRCRGGVGGHVGGRHRRPWRRTTLSECAVVDASP
jgi:hypothetical protein